MGNPTIRCPECGNEDVDLFRYVEDIRNWRPCQAMEGSKLTIDAYYKTDGYDDGTNPRLECHAASEAGEECLHAFPIPEGIELEFM